MKLVNWIALGTAVILIGAVFIGYKMGFLRVAAALAAVVAAAFFSSMLAPCMTEALRQYTPLYEAVKENISGYLSEGLEHNSENRDIIDYEAQSTLLERLPLPRHYRDELAGESLQGRAEQELEGFIGTVSGALADIIVQVTGYILTYLLLQALIMIAYAMLKILTKIPLLNKTNQMFGALSGLLFALAVIWLLFLIMTALAGTAWGMECLEMIDENPVLRFIYNCNPVFLLL